MAIIKKGKRKKFEYQPRTAEGVNAHRAKTGAREGFIKPDVKVWTPKDGENTVRLFPPTWEDEEQTGLTYRVFAHYGIGPDNAAFLCLHQMHGEDCPICDSRMKADKRGDEDLVKELRPTQRGAAWIIVRGEERKGPQLWLMPKTIDQELHMRLSDKKTGTILPVDHPEDGYDLSFERVKAKGKQFPEYKGVGFERRSSPLSDDEDDVQEWLDFVAENPVPDQLVYHEAEHIKDTFGGEITRSKAAAARKKDDENEAKPGGRGKKKSKELPTWEELHDMDEDELEEFAEEFEIDLKGDFDSEEEVADFICAVLEIEKPRKSKRRSDDDDEEDRPKKRARKDDDDDDEEDEKPRRKGSVSRRDRDEDGEDEKPKASWKARLGKFRK